MNKHFEYGSAISGERPFVITSDASGKVIRGVLSQIDEKKGEE